MTTSRRQFLGWSAAALTTTTHAVRAATPRDVPRFDLGIASGQPTASSVVLWTRLTGGDLPERVAVSWELAHDEAFKRIARFAPYVAGDSFTMADCVAFSNLPLIGMATRAVYGEDLLLTAGVDYKPYLKLVGERPSAQKVVEDRKAEIARPKT